MSHVCFRKVFAPYIPIKSEPHAQPGRVTIFPASERTNIWLHGTRTLTDKYLLQTSHRAETASTKGANDAITCFGNGGQHCNTRGINFSFDRREAASQTKAQNGSANVIVSLAPGAREVPSVRSSLGIKKVASQQRRASQKKKKRGKGDGPH